MGFDTCVQFVLNEEGGYSHNPKDPGGETRYGISKRAYPDLNIKELKINQAIDIYNRDYWILGRCHLLPDRMQLCFFDACVNQGIDAASRDLQRALNVVVDGRVGAQTLRAAHLFGPSLLGLFAAERARRYALSQNFETFGRGWLARLFRAVLASSVI